MKIDLSNIFMKRNAVSRSLSAENFRGLKGKGGMATADSSFNPTAVKCARELGQKWKMSPSMPIKAGQVVTIMDNDGPGVIRHIWITLDPKFYRNVIIRMYWDGADSPSVEVPIGDFMCCSWNTRQNILAQPINVNPIGGMNCYFPMPFKKHARITIENDSAIDLNDFFYTINYTLEEVDPDALYFHAQWRRTNPIKYGDDYLMIDNIKGCGQYVGTFMSWQQNNAGWWGEGEIKMFIDGDQEFPTICGTGTEDYFGGAWGFGRQDYSAPYLGFLQVQGKSDSIGTRMTMYRFHLLDPVFFKQDLKITMQAIGWRSEGRFLPLQDDIASVVYWYQDKPAENFPLLLDRNQREII